MQERSNRLLHFSRFLELELSVPVEVSHEGVLKKLGVDEPVAICGLLGRLA
jgi:hypothetical protein